MVGQGSQNLAALAMLLIATVSLAVGAAEDPQAKTEGKGSQAAVRTWTAILVNADTGSPLPGITAELNVTKKGSREPQVVTMTSSAEGQLEIPVATGQTINVEITAPGWWQPGWQFDLSAFKTSDGKPFVFNPTKPVRVELWKGTVVKGQLLAPDGTPAAGVALNVGVNINSMEWMERLGMPVTFNSWDHGQWPNWARRVVTRKDGSFLTTVPPPSARSWVRVGTGRLGFGEINPLGLDDQGPSKALFKYAPFEHELQGSSEDPQASKSKDLLDLGKLQLERGVVLKGRIVDAKGNPLANIPLRTSGKHGPYAGRSVISAKDGTFAFLPMNPGTITLNADARISNEKGETISRDVRAVFVSQNVTIPASGSSIDLTVQAVPHVSLEFEWVDRRAKKGPVAYYGAFTIIGRVPRVGQPPVSWRGETEKTTRGGREVLFVKVPAAILEPTLYLPADELVTASYKDDHTRSGPGSVSLGDITKPRRRVIYGDEPREEEKNDARAPKNG